MLPDVQSILEVLVDPVFPTTIVSLSSQRCSCGSCDLSTRHFTSSMSMWTLSFIVHFHMDLSASVHVACFMSQKPSTCMCVCVYKVDQYVQSIHMYIQTSMLKICQIYYIFKFKYTSPYICTHTVFHCKGLWSNGIQSVLLLPPLLPTGLASRLCNFLH